jgi:hypothetical protein
MGSVLLRYTLLCAGLGYTLMAVLLLIVLQGCGYGIYGDVQGVAGHADDGGVAIGIGDECAGNRVAIL